MMNVNAVWVKMEMHFVDIFMYAQRCLTKSLLHLSLLKRLKIPVPLICLYYYYFLNTYCMLKWGKKGVLFEYD